MYIYVYRDINGYPISDIIPIRESPPHTHTHTHTPCPMAPLSGPICSGPGMGGVGWAESLMEIFPYWA